MSETAPRGPSTRPRRRAGTGCADCDAADAAGLVGAPAPVRRVRPRRLLRQLARPSTPPRTPPPPGTASSRASSRARTGSGTTATSRWSTGRPSRRPTSHPADQPVPGPRGPSARATGASTSTDAGLPQPLAVPLGPACLAVLPRLTAALAGDAPVLPFAASTPPPVVPTPRPGRPARRSGRRRRHLRLDRHPQARAAHGRGAARQQPGHARAPRRPRAVAARAAGPPRRRSAGAAAVAGCRHQPRRDGPHRRLPPAGVRRGRRAARARATPLHQPGAHPAAPAAGPPPRARGPAHVRRGARRRCRDATAAASPGRAEPRARPRHLRHERDRRRMRLRRKAVALHRDRLRRGEPYPPGWAHGRPRLPRPPRPDRRGVRRRRGRDALVPHRRRRSPRRTTVGCTSTAASTTWSTPVG